MNWDYSGYDAEELRLAKDEYFFQDLIDQVGGNVDKFRKGDFVIVSKNNLGKRGIDLNNFEIFDGQNYSN